MNWFAKLLGFANVADGLEVEILRLVPAAFMLGSLSIALPSVLARILLHPEAQEISRITALDSMALGALLVHGLALIAVIVGAVIVHNWKRPAYVADTDALNEAEDLEPAPSML